MMIHSASTLKNSSIRRTFRAPLLSKPQVAVRCTSNKTGKCTAKEQKLKEPEFEEGPLPSSQQVETFLSTLCTDTDVAEVSIQMPTYKLKVRRSTSSSGKSAASPPASSAPVSPSPAAVPTPAPKPVAKVEPVAVVEESTDDENSVVVSAKKVGIFRRGRYAAGKRVGKNNCVNKGDRLKKGQTLGFIEQLGTHVPVECPVAGELIKFNVEDGKPVEYSQAICEVTPFFGGYTGSDRATKVVA